MATDGEAPEPSIQYRDKTLLAVNALDKFYPMRVRSRAPHAAREP